MAEATTGVDARLWRCCGVLDTWLVLRRGHPDAIGMQLGSVMRPLLRRYKAQVRRTTPSSMLCPLSAGSLHGSCALYMACPASLALVITNY